MLYCYIVYIFPPSLHKYGTPHLSEPIRFEVVYTTFHQIRVIHNVDPQTPPEGKGPTTNPAWNMPDYSELPRLSILFLFDIYSYLQTL